MSLPLATQIVRWEIGELYDSQKTEKRVVNEKMGSESLSLCVEIGRAIYATENRGGNRGNRSQME
jgi:hypothetical protein